MTFYFYWLGWMKTLNTWQAMWISGEQARITKAKEQAGE